MRCGPVRRIHSAGCAAKGINPRGKPKEGLEPSPPDYETGALPLSHSGLYAVPPDRTGIFRASTGCTFQLCQGGVGPPRGGPCSREDSNLYFQLRKLMSSPLDDRNGARHEGAGVPDGARTRSHQLHRLAALLFAFRHHRGGAHASSEKERQAGLEPAPRAWQARVPPKTPQSQRQASGGDRTRDLLVGNQAFHRLNHARKLSKAAQGVEPCLAGLQPDTPPGPTATAPAAGFEPATPWLTARCSTIELHRNRAQSAQLKREETNPQNAHEHAKPFHTRRTHMDGFAFIQIHIKSVHLPKGAWREPGPPFGSGPVKAEGRAKEKAEPPVWEPGLGRWTLSVHCYPGPSPPLRRS